MKPKHIAISLGSVLVSVLVVVVVLWLTTDGSETKGEIRVEIVKSLLQLSVVVIIGGGIAALYKAIEHSRAQQQKDLEHSRAQQQKDLEQFRKEDEIRAAIRTDFLHRLGSIYRVVKGARRTLRSGGLTTKFGNAPERIEGDHAKIYCKQMIRINRAQLDLEGLTIEAERFPAFIPLNKVAENLCKMEDYLRQVLKNAISIFQFIGTNYLACYVEPNVKKRHKMQAATDWFGTQFIAGTLLGQIVDYLTLRAHRD